MTAPRTVAHARSDVGRVTGGVMSADVRPVGGTTTVTRTVAHAPTDVSRLAECVTQADARRAGGATRVAVSVAVTVHPGATRTGPVSAAV
jgi:hypothetical protein